MSNNEHDYIPSREADLLPWTENFVQKVENYKEELEVPDKDVKDLKASQIYFKSMIQQSNGPEATAVIRAKKNEAKADLLSKIRPIVSFRMKNPAIPNDMRIEMGLRPRDAVRTPHIDVTESVESEIKLDKIREITVSFWIKGEKHHAKPHGYDGAVIIWDILDSPPADPHDLTRHTMASKTPHILKFTEEERGATVYIALAWQNERGNIGAWSEIKSAIVP